MPRITVKEFSFTALTEFASQTLIKTIDVRDSDVIEVFIILSDVQGAPTTLSFTLSPNNPFGSFIRGVTTRRVVSAAPPVIGDILALRNSFDAIEPFPLIVVNDFLYLFYTMSGGVTPTISGTVYFLCRDGAYRPR